MRYIVLGITGKRGSGKDTTAEYLGKRYGFNILVYTDHVLAPMLKLQKKKVTRENLIKLATDLRKQYGKEALTRMICERITRKEPWCISGVRLPEEVAYLRSFYCEAFFLLDVECESKKRYERLKSRGTKGEKKMSYKKFMEIDRKVTERPIKESTELADHMIDNNGSMEELKRQLDDLMKNMGVKKNG